MTRGPPASLQAAPGQAAWFLTPHVAILGTILLTSDDTRWTSRAGVVCSTPPSAMLHTPYRAKGKHMAKPQETRQEQETRWTAQRAARDKDFQVRQDARHQKNRRTWVIVAGIVLIVAVIVAVMLL